MDEAARRARRTYDAAADHYDDPALGFWSRVGSRTVERLALPPGAAILDVPCGSGASALPAARAVGAHGSVLAVDLSAALLARARAKAAGEGLENLTFRVADMRALGEPDGAFDAVVCVFGIFFVDDMPALARELWRMVRRGGTLAVTTWGAGGLEPLAGVFWDAVGDVRRDLKRGFNPWDTLVTVELVSELFRAAGIEGATAELEPGEQPVRGPDDWWSIVLGTGFRGTVDALDRRGREHVEQRVRTELAGVSAMQAPAIFATARRPDS